MHSRTTLDKPTLIGEEVKKSNERSSSHSSQSLFKMNNISEQIQENLKTSFTNILTSSKRSRSVVPNKRFELQGKKTEEFVNHEKTFKKENGTFKIKINF
jgi:hypothetical protein